MVNPNSDSKEKIILAAKNMAQAHGYNGLNFRDLAEAVGIRAASIYHHFPSKADLAAAVAKRYWEDSAAELEIISAAQSAPESLRKYPRTFRKSLQNNNRMCLSSFMSTEYDDLPDHVLKEVHNFADVNIDWLKKNLLAATNLDPVQCEARAKIIFAAISGAQLLARSRSDISLYDTIIDGLFDSGLIPVSRHDSE